MENQNPILHPNRESAAPWHIYPLSTNHASEQNKPSVLVGDSQQTRRLLALIKQVAPARANVLIEGESGTGKEIVARTLHSESPRANEPFLGINCKAFPSGLIESELFGHEKGSFTGASAPHAGYFERAAAGTLFLDEIAEADIDFQAKLLRVLDNREALRIGGSKPYKINARILTATNRVLADEVAAGRFRSDLYFRLNVIPIQLSPLRDRRGDILPLAQFFLSHHATRLERSMYLSRQAQQALLSYDWPGNVRELENIIERATVFSRTAEITLDALSLNQAARPSAERTVDTLRAALDKITGEKIRDALNRAGGNRMAAARSLGIERTTLYRLINRHLLT